KKVRRDQLKHAWMLHHRDLFQPLLSSSKFFDTLQELGQHRKIVPFRELDEQPKLVQGSMKDYQLQGLSFMASMFHNGMNCILGDEMGLGKTLQTLSLFAYIHEIRGKYSLCPQDPHLVICPLSVLSAWENEAARWVPGLKCQRFYGSQQERERIKISLRTAKFDLLLTTYETFVGDDGWFKSRPWTICVLDEGHKIRNAGNNVSHKLQGIGSLYRIRKSLSPFLTGTPVQNNLLELWGLLHWLYPTCFTEITERIFRNSFDIAKGAYALPFINAASSLLSAIMIRRTKDVVEGDVPPREELTVFVPMSEAQRFWTYRMLTRINTKGLNEIFQAKVDDIEMSEGRREVLLHLENHANEGTATNSTGGNKWSKLMNLLLQLRRVCDHPYLIKDAEPEPYYIGEHIVASSSKLVIIDKILADVLPRGEQVLIFSQWTGMLDLLEDFMHLRDIPYARLDGSTPRPRRSLDIRLFQKESSPYKVYLISTKAGGLGINLTKASHVIMVDSDWNPQNDLQAIARAHRIGQTKTVKVYRLICHGSVEDQMLASLLHDRLRRKLFLSLKLMKSDGSASEQNETMGLKELMDILRKGSSAISNEAQGVQSLEHFLGAKLEDILEGSRNRGSARDMKIKTDLKVEGEEVKLEETLLSEAEEEHRLLLSGVAQVQARLFEGKVVKKMDQNNKQIAQEWRDLQKRARNDRTIVIDGMSFIVDPPELQCPAPLKAKKGPKFDWEDYCINCRDGGELICCAHCPRVFHEGCGVMPLHPKMSGTAQCDQHRCIECRRPASDAGGLLFRCQTCPRAFCEDCMPFDRYDDVDLIGETLPEFLLLNYPEKQNAYFVACHYCKVRSKTDTTWRRDWDVEIAKAKRALAALGN
ncbi:P-loop containing nucleoside triphosphate hydrolase protein, partial [Mycena floridula]